MMTFITTQNLKRSFNNSKKSWSIQINLQDGSLETKQSSFLMSLQSGLSPCRRGSKIWATVVEWQRRKFLDCHSNAWPQVLREWVLIRLQRLKEPTRWENFTMTLNSKVCNSSMLPRSRKILHRGKLLQRMTNSIGNQIWIWLLSILVHDKIEWTNWYVQKSSSEKEKKASNVVYRIKK